METVHKNINASSSSSDEMRAESDSFSSDIESPDNFADSRDNTSLTINPYNRERYTSTNQ